VSLFRTKTAAARAIGSLSRRSGRGGGTSLPGKTLLRLAPDAIERLAGRLTDGVVLVSATNGKTTTSTLAAAALAPDRVLCRNGAGANLLSGIASALLDAPPGAQLGLFEVDEFALPEVARRTRPRALLLQNLFRDQLDRYGELELVAERWRAMAAALPPETALVLCADDPVVSALGDGRDHVIRFGLDDPSVALAGLADAADSTTCIRCGHAYDYAAVYLGHLGDYHCPNCGHARPALDVPVRDIELRGLEGSAFTAGSTRLAIGLPGIYNVENAAGAFALATALGVPPAAAAERIGSARGAFGRFERVVVGDRDAVLLLVKNPAGANEALRTLQADADGAVLLLALNDRIADGRDVSWIWDVDYETVLPHAARVVCSGTRAADIALRAKYAGVHPDRIEIVPGRADALDRALERAGSGGTAYVLPTYTAMLELQRVAAERGLVRPYWEAAAT
jgi:UDP-N-acetylmuramyl tripeptide synthase